jgi:hypothetical protein
MVTAYHHHLLHLHLHLRRRRDHKSTPPHSGGSETDSNQTGINTAACVLIMIVFAILLLRLKKTPRMQNEAGEHQNANDGKLIARTSLDAKVLVQSQCCGSEWRHASDCVSLLLKAGANVNLSVRNSFAIKAAARRDRIEFN